MPETNQMQPGTEHCDHEDVHSDVGHVKKVWGGKPTGGGGTAWPGQARGDTATAE